MHGAYGGSSLRRCERITPLLWFWTLYLFWSVLSFKVLVATFLVSLRVDSPRNKRLFGGISLKLSSLQLQKFSTLWTKIKCIISVFGH
ncbi:hypothetical protein Bca101_096474 [Brassica carinata]